MLQYYWKLFRGWNLLIIIFTMLIMQYTWLSPYIHSGIIPPLAFSMAFTALTVSIVLIAAGGNCINDCLDITSDELNNKCLCISHQPEDLRKVKHLYIGITLCGLLIGIIPAIYIHSAWFYIIFPACAALLYAYSANLKRRPLIGNISIALLTAMVVITLYIFNTKVYYLTGHVDTSYRLTGLLIASSYAFFAFWFTLIRELIKTMEDIQGDAGAGYHTTAVAYGTKTTKILTCSLIVIITCVLCVIGILLLRDGNGINPSVGYYTLIGLVLPCIALLIRTATLHTTAHCHQASLMTKGIMLIGILGLVLLYLL